MTVIKQMPQLAGNDFLSALVFCQFKPVELTEFLDRHRSLRRSVHIFLS